MTSTNDLFAPLTRREAAKLRVKLRECLHAITDVYPYEKEPEGLFAEIAWLEGMAERQAGNRDAAWR